MRLDEVASLISIRSFIVETLNRYALENPEWIDFGGLEALARKIDKKIVVALEQISNEL